MGVGAVVGVGTSGTVVVMVAVGGSVVVVRGADVVVVISPPAEVGATISMASTLIAVRREYELRSDLSFTIADGEPGGRGPVSNTRCW